MAAARLALMAPRPHAGAVLCGGASSRMGTDKALLELDAAPMAVRVAQALRASGAERVVAVGGHRLALTAAGLEVIDDQWPGEGPLGGIVTALDATEEPVIVVLACDLLDPSSDTVGRLVDALGDSSSSGIDIAVPLLDGRRQYDQLAVRTGRAREVLAAEFARGVRAIHRALDALVVAEVHDLAPATLRDADTPSDLRLR